LRIEIEFLTHPSEAKGRSAVRVTDLAIPFFLTEDPLSRGLNLRGIITNKIQDGALE
jgi:hypothetical protein